MRQFRLSTLVLALAVTCAIPASPAVAQDPFVNAPNGNPTGAASADSPTYIGGFPPGPYWYTVTLSPGQANSAQAMSPGVTLTDVLGAQGFSLANGWTINRFGLQGTMTLNRYLAWTENAPA